MHIYKIHATHVYMIHLSAKLNLTLIMEPELAPP